MTNKVKSILFVSGLIISAIMAVLSFHFEETAKKPFWYNAWPYFGGVFIILFIGGIYWFSQSKKKW